MLAKSVRACLITENGHIYRGKSFGHVTEAIGELIFTSANPGYQEIITDPVNTGKIVVATSPLIGNYGINLEDMESATPKINGLIVREKCNYPNNWRCEMELAGYLKQQRIMALEGIDTRSLTIMLREHGSMKGIITTRELSASQVLEKFASFNNKNAVRSCTCKEPVRFNPDGGTHLAVLDLGIKKSVLDALINSGQKLTVFPAFTPARELLDCGCEGFFISDGPGSPRHIPSVSETIKEILAERASKPIYAYGLGMLCLAQALGCKTEKLKFGHHSPGPIKELETGKILLPWQNHDEYVSDITPNITVTHININDGTIEGIRCGNAIGTMFYSEANNKQSDGGTHISA